MRRLKRIALSILMLPILVMGLSVAGLIVVWSFPHLAINSRTLPWLITKALGPTVGFTSKELLIEFQKPDFWSLSIRFNGNDVCVDQRETKSCFSATIDSDLRLSMSDGLVIPSLTIHSTNFSLDSEKGSAGQSTATGFERRTDAIDFSHRLIKLWALLEARQTNVVKLRFDRVKLAQAHLIPAFSFSLEAQRAERTARITFQTAGPSNLRVQSCDLLWAGSVGDSVINGKCSWAAAWPTNLKALNLTQRTEISFDSIVDLRLSNGHLTDSSKIEVLFRSWDSNIIELHALLRPANFTGPTPAIRWEIGLMATSLQLLHPLLARLGVEVPAPFHVLDGSCELTWRGMVTSSWVESAESEFLVALHLRSTEQILNAEGRGSLQINGLINQSPIDVLVELDLTLTKMELIAPPLRLWNAPTLMPDRRFKGAQKSRQGENPFRIKYDVRVHTQKPLLIKTDLTRSPVPISFDLRFRSDQSPTGNIRVHRVALDLFRRDVEIQQFSVTLLPSGRAHPVRGEIRVRYVGYVVNVLIDGEFNRPRIQLRSQPLLSEDDIHAVLLFGSPLRSLGTADVSSVASFKGAAVSRALTLASLYFLIGTPVQSISFNPQTMAFSAQVRLPRSVALNLGVEDEGARYLGLRKRLSDEFYLETEVRHPEAVATEGSGAALSTYFVWFKRH